MILFKGKKKGMIHTMNIEWEHLREVFFPRTFSEHYRYLGYIWVDEKSSYFQYIMPLVLTMDYYAKPRWCPRWFLRFLYLFGNDNSIIRVRNRKLHNLHTRLTKGIKMWDWKTKWSDYDLRISISGSEMLQNLAQDLENRCYHHGRKKEVIARLKTYPELEGQWQVYSPLFILEEVLRKKEEDIDEN